MTAPEEQANCSCVGPQFYSQVDTSNLPSDVIGKLLDTPFGQRVQTEGEDCLTVSVQRPSTANTNSKLPVVAWLFGGGFEFGSTQTYDGTGFVQQSALLGKPVIYVSINYRVGGFGFLAGKELQGDGSTNLGLRDQRLGLQWIQDNIASFGGDPTKVVIWGESAGSISVFDQTIINGGDNSYNGGSLFRGAIMDSGSITPALDVASPTAQNVYNTVVSNAGCSGKTDTLACLRALPYTAFLNAANSVPAIFSYRSLDLSYLPRPDPSNNFFPQSPELATQAGNVAKVPVIIGDQMDEGTLFAITLGNVTTADRLVAYLQTYLPQASQADVAGLVTTYPADITAGSPFNTGVLNELYPGFKRNAAILGDITFTLGRRGYLNAVTKSGVKAWSYLGNYYYGTPVLGTFHASDVASLYFNVPPGPALTIRTHYVSFVNSLDPNTIFQLVKWPQWTAGSTQLLQFNAIGNTIVQDNFRSSSYDYITSHQGVFHV